MSGVLLTHRGAVRVNRQALMSIEPPAATATWKPVAHGVLVNTLTEVLSNRGIAVKKEEYAVQRHGNMLFGVLDLVWGGTIDYYAALGLRTSNDKSFAIQIAIGARVIICDNLLMSGELIALRRKHTAGLALAEELTAGIRRYELGYQQYMRHLEFLQRTPWSPREARERIYEVFARRIVPVRLFPQLAPLYLERQQTATAWEVLNSFTTAMKQLPLSVQFASTVKLGKFFSQPPCVFPTQPHDGVVV
jgi:hypothetical protein